MSNTKIELRSIETLKDLNFFIPSYQRGYRWKEQQVNDLLDDIDEFINNKSKVNQIQDDFYCLQPLVVKETVPDEDKLINELPKRKEADLISNIKKTLNSNTMWEVIDGQQRLTTVYILLGVLKNSDYYSIKYETRKDSKTFLKNLQNEDEKDEKDEEKNIDYYHIYNAKTTIDKWFAIKTKSKTTEESKNYKTSFKDTLLKKVQFIWYESDEDSIKVFTRLNIGKIGLTNAELIKALFLNRSNFVGEDYEKVRLKQYEIASQWDRIEYTLQNEEFWLFLHETEYTNPTRIDFIFDLMCNMGSLDTYIECIKESKKNIIDSDKYRTFRYFNKYFHSDTAKTNAQKNNITIIEQCWEIVRDVFQTFDEWFNDSELYHYVGYLIENKAKLNEILDNCLNKTKKDFVNYLKKGINTKIKDCNDLDKEYEIKDSPKTLCKPILLLHNIQTVINQNKNSVDAYGLGVFYKFPFHLYKKEKWDVEHIDSNTQNDLNEKVDQNEFLLNIYNSVSHERQEKIKNFINNKPDAENFNSLKNLFQAKSNDPLTAEEKNEIWNFTLLDSHTNRSYGNFIFSSKRRIIIGKDKGKLIPVPKIGRGGTLVVDEEKYAQSSFIPPCTKQVFLKYYSPSSASPNFWDKSDAVAYRKDIFETLKDFGVTEEKIKEAENGKY